MVYNYSKETVLSFEKAIEKTKEELKKRGFGILTEIDVKSTLKQKLDVDYDDYVILGACNPPFAYRALQAEKEIGLLLPCNVIVYKKDDKTVVSAINPIEGMSVVENNVLEEIAKTIKQKLEEVINNVE